MEWSYIINRQAREVGQAFTQESKGYWCVCVCVCVCKRGLPTQDSGVLVSWLGATDAGDQGQSVAMTAGLGACVELVWSLGREGD